MIAILVAGLGVATTLVALIYQSQKDIGLLGLIGATGAQIRRIVVYGGIDDWSGKSTDRNCRWRDSCDGLDLRDQRAVVRLDDTVSLSLSVRGAVHGLCAGCFGTLRLYPAVRAASVDALATVREQNE